MYEHDKFARQFYSSHAWKLCRNAYKASVHGLCEQCLSAGLYKAGDHVHHKTKLTPENIDDPSVALAFDNLQLLCEQCHMRLHNGERGGVRRYVVDEDGEVRSVD